VEWIGQAADAGGLGMTAQKEEKHPIEHKIGSQPSQPTDLERNPAAKQTVQRDGRLNRANQQHGVAQRNAQVGFRQRQDRGVSGGNDETDQCRRQQYSAG